MICLDNDILTKFLKPSPNQDVVSYLVQHRHEKWATPSLVAFEYYRKFNTPQQIHRVRRRINNIVDEILPVTEDVAIEAVNLNNTLQSQNISLDNLDLLHAGTAREANCTFVTANKNDFDKAPIHQLMNVDVIHT